MGYFRAVKGETRGGLLSDAQFQVWIDWLVQQGQLPAGRLRASDVYTNAFNRNADTSR